DINGAGLRLYRHVHEYIEAHRNAIGFDSEFAQRHGEVAETAPVRFGVAVKLAEHFGAARTQQKVMAPDFVFDYFQHDVAPVRIKRMTGCQQYGSRIVDGTT